ncbi:arf-GAP domain and FG repeat-containing protein 2 isoform X6 [Arvicanthis niloticus]|uniref:arf-GAP domain and FG repeat-containing protein 2 isoform X6 n=1 Tax=Arvicanthis niloticus TaxID=61156 RepID=UPI00402BAAC5
MVMAAKKGPGPGGGAGGSKAEAEAASEVWCRRVRELGGCSQAGNRHCFECAQRGVTYVDITVGSFVCTTCSGLLRGLNPPHRVKSISMTTFTEPEVLFLQSRGNEVCRKIWLGLFDARTSLIPDSRDPQKVKEFLQEKYEKKRWYVPPEQVKGPSYSKGSVSATPVQGSVPEGKPIRTLLGDPVPSLSDAATSSNQKASTDLLADIGGDPFAAPQMAPAFASFPGFGGSNQMSAFAVAPLAAASQPNSLTDVGSLLGPRMAAGGLPGSVFGMPSQVPALQSAVPGVSGSAGLPFGAFTNPFATPAQPQLPSTNPFQPNGLASGPGFGMGSVRPGLLQPVPPSGAFASTFPAPVFPTQAGLAEQQNGSSFGDLGTSKLGQRPLSQPAGVSTNPFMTGPSAFASKPPTTNPFL